MSFLIELIIIFSVLLMFPFIIIAIHLTHCDVLPLMFIFLTLLFMYLFVCVTGVFKPRSHWPSWLLSFDWWLPHLGPRCLHPHAPTSRCAGCGSHPRCREGQLGGQLCPQEPKNVRSATVHCPVEDQLFCERKIQGDALTDSMKFNLNCHLFNPLF